MARYLIIILLFFSASAISAQSLEEEIPSSRTAFLKSLVLPGWGHYYVNSSNWTRGKYHLGADALLLLSYFGFNIHSNNLQQNWFGYARSGAGIEIEDRSRSLQLAVGDFNNLAAYNDFQARSRNWDNFIDDTPANSWSWQNDKARDKYNNIRNRFENIDQQLPALIGLMVVNRVISAVSAYNRARKMDHNPSSAFYFSPIWQGGGIQAHLKIGL